MTADTATEFADLVIKNLLELSIACASKFARPERFPRRGASRRLLRKTTLPVRVGRESNMANSGLAES